MRRLLQACLAIAVLSAVGVDAAAQEDEVFVDPDSPAGKEYAIPLDEARREAGGGSPGGPPGAAAPFGEGITPEDAEAERRDSADDEVSDPPQAEGDTETSSPTLGGRGSAAAALDQGGPSAGLITGGVALGVLLVGGLVGLVVRRMSP